LAVLRRAGGWTDAQAQMSLIADRLEHEHPDTNRQRGIQVYTLSGGMTDIGLPPLMSLWQAAGLFVLLIACANIANLLLARGAERGREVAIRLALGSSRGRIVRESLLESGLLGLAAAPLAIGIAWLFLALMRAFMPGRIVRFIAGWNQLAIDGRLVAVTVAMGMIAALVFGTIPALQTARGQVSDALKSDGRTGSGPGRQRLRRGLVVAEIALALPLLVAAMLSIDTVRQYLTNWQGYDPANVLTLRIVLPAAQYPDADSRRQFVDAALDELRAVPSISSAAIGNIVPALDSNDGRRIELAGQPPVDPANRPAVDYRTVSPAYFDVLRMPILAGRAFATSDHPGSAPVAISSQSMARKYWPQGGELGGQLRIAQGPWLTVVGVCGDVIHDWFDSRNVPTLYRRSLRRRLTRSSSRLGRPAIRERSWKTSPRWRGSTPPSRSSMS
jgi:predicted permease